jgi:hypothetical protein
MGAVSDAIDSQFIAMMIDTGSPSIASTSPLADVRAALMNVSTVTVGQAKLYWIASADTAKLGSTLSTNAPAFAAVSAVGGELANLPMVVSSGLPDGQLALIDGSGIAADGADITVQVSKQATVLQNTAPSMSSAAPTPGTGLTSLWQTNSSALLATAWFAASKLRDDAICAITGISSTTWSSA